MKPAGRTCTHTTPQGSRPHVTGAWLQWSISRCAAATAIEGLDIRLNDPVTLRVNLSTEAGLAVFIVDGDARIELPGADAAATKIESHGSVVEIRVPGVLTAVFDRAQNRLMYARAPLLASLGLSGRSAGVPQGGLTLE